MFGNKVYLVLAFFLFEAAALNADILDYIVKIEIKLDAETEVVNRKITAGNLDRDIVNPEKDSKDFLPVLQSPGFIYVDDDGNNFIISANNNFCISSQVNIELFANGITKKTYLNCPILYIDQKSGLAVMQFPENEKVFSEGIELDKKPKDDNSDVFAVSENPPELINGKIINFKSMDENIFLSDIAGMIKYSAAALVHENSPLLYQYDEFRFKVVGIDRFSTGENRLIRYAIPAENIGNAIRTAKETSTRIVDNQYLKQKLINSCLILSSELSSEYPDYTNISKFISKDFFARHGWISYLNILELENEESVRWQKHFSDFPVKVIKNAISFYLVSAIQEKTKAIQYESINYADIDAIGFLKNIRTNFVFGGEKIEVVWTFESGSWYISHINIDLENMDKGNTENPPKPQPSGTALGFEFPTAYILTKMPGEQISIGIAQYISICGETMFGTSGSVNTGFYYGIGYCINYESIEDYSYIGNITLLSHYFTAKLGLRLVFASGWFLDLGAAPELILAARYADTYGSEFIEVAGFPVTFPVQLSGGYIFKLSNKTTYHLGIAIHYTPTDNSTYPFKLILVQRFNFRVSAEEK